jgi:hypothetical protein
MANREFTPKIKVGDKYGPAMEITNEKAAAEYFEKCVRHSMYFGNSRARAEQIERVNLGYYSGYYDHETMKRVERLFLAPHPILGSSK